jgi:hypothetical protein
MNKMARKIMRVRWMYKMKVSRTLTNNKITHSNTPHNKPNNPPPTAFANGCRTTTSNPHPSVTCPSNN